MNPKSKGAGRKTKKGRSLTGGQRRGAVRAAPAAAYQAAAISAASDPATASAVERSTASVAPEYSTAMPVGNAARHQSIAEVYACREGSSEASQVHGGQDRGPPLATSFKPLGACFGLPTQPACAPGSSSTTKTQQASATGAATSPQAAAATEEAAGSAPKAAGRRTTAAGDSSSAGQLAELLAELQRRAVTPQQKQALVQQMADWLETPARGAAPPPATGTAPLPATAVAQAASHHESRLPPAQRGLLPQQRQQQQQQQQEQRRQNKHSHFRSSSLVEALHAAQHSAAPPQPPHPAGQDGRTRAHVSQAKLQLQPQQTGGPATPGPEAVTLPDATDEATPLKTGPGKLKKEVAALLKVRPYA